MSKMSERGNEVAERTFVSFGEEKLCALSDALWPGVKDNALLGTFRLLTRPWGERLIGSTPKHRSNIADDEAPFEFSVAFSRGAPEIQVYVEPQGDLPTPAMNLSRGREVLEATAAALGASLTRFRAIEDAFLPSHPKPPFSLWIGASWTPGRDVLLKVYLNPQVRGPERAVQLVESALERLGMGTAWSKVASVLPLGDGRATLGIVCLDLANERSARLKLYVRHHRATLEDLTAVAALTGEHTPQDVAAFYSATAETSGPFSEKPPITEITFMADRTRDPASTTLEFPIGSYVENDDVARQRVERCLGRFGLASEPYARALHAFSNRPLATRAGLHAHVTLRRLPTGPRVAIYLTSEAYSATKREV